MSRIRTSKVNIGAYEHVPPDGTVLMVR